VWGWGCWWFWGVVVVCVGWWGWFVGCGWWGGFGGCGVGFLGGCGVGGLVGVVVGGGGVLGVVGCWVGFVFL
jgi:hypothetical protein